MLPPLYGTRTQNEEVLTSNKCFEGLTDNHLKENLMSWFLGSGEHDGLVVA